MSPEEYESKLTAFALKDPSLTADEHREIEKALARDPAAQKQVDETRQIAAMLTKGLAAELETPNHTANTGIIIPSQTPPARTFKRFLRDHGVSLTLAGSVLVGFGILFNVPLMAKKAPVQLASNFRDDSQNEKSGDAPLAEDDVNTAPKDSLPHPQRWADGASPAPGGGLPSPLEAPGRNWSIPKSTTPEKKLYLHPGEGLPAGGVVAEGGKNDPVENKILRESIKLNGKGGEIPNDPILLPKSRELDGLHDELQGTNRFQAEPENKFIAVKGQDALSTFGVDVDTASYSIVRKFLANNQLPPAAAVRLEEMVNYFPYRDAPPEGDDPYKVTVELAECPWQPTHKLARIGLKAKPIDNDRRPASNLVFLVDVSGSMDSPNRLPWVKQSLRMLVDQLKESDRVAIVVYASACGVVLDSTRATNKNTILREIDRLQAGGSTNGGSGIQLAYDVASKNFIEGGTNRVILCTDGDWNVGTTSTEALMEMIEAKRKTGVFLSVLGFGMGNLRDEMMVKLTGKGNGNYAYIDELKEARKVLVEQLSGTLVTVAKDVKIQIEFNPARIASYRLLGYEKRALAARDFADDKKDSGEMGAGHVVTALYEIVPTEGAAVPVKKDEGLKYQDPAPVTQPAPAAKGLAGEAFTLKLRHKMPSSDVSTLREIPVKDVTVPYAQASEDFRFAAAVASFAMILRESPYKGHSSFGLVSELARAAKTYDPNEYRAEFIQMVEKAKQVSGRP